MLPFALWKRFVILGVVALGLLYAAPNMLPGGYWPGQPVNLGLDLQGGSHLLLRADMDAVIKERLTSTTENLRQSFRDERIRFKDLTVEEGEARFTLRNADDSDARDRILANFTADYDVVHTDLVTQLRFSEAGILELRTRTIEQAIEIIRRRLDPDGTKEPIIQRQGADRILIQLPGVDDPERIKALLGQTARLTFQLVDTRTTASEARASGRVPPGTMLLPSANPEEDRYYLVEKRVMVSGEMLDNAVPGFDQNNQPAVNFTLNATGARLFGQVTGENIGRAFAIVLDDKVVSAPTIRAQIFANGQISGSFSVQETNDLALVLRAGALPAPLIVLEERSIGPGLGADSIAAGQIAALVGMVLVILFMIGSYGLFGVFANVALIINALLIIAALSFLQATLTLPGIAGIVLTMGMAVDANVLIFERIREELARKRALRSAIEAGYDRAIATIVDANLTTLFAAIFLYIFGSGPIKGFAVTLSLGIVTSMFTAILVTRLFVVLWVNRTKPKSLVL